MKKFAQDSKLKVITLEPQNSFVRRLQHKKIVDSGFISNSVGEGPSRSVQMKRSQ